MIRRPPRSTLSSSSAASDVYKRQDVHSLLVTPVIVGNHWTRVPRPYNHITLRSRLRGLRGFAWNLLARFGPFGSAGGNAGDRREKGWSPHPYGVWFWLQQTEGSQ